MKKQIMIVMLVLLTLATANSNVLATDPGNKDLAAIRRATAPYLDIDKALEAGYEPLFDCTVNPNNPEEAMGQHYINFSLVDDVLELEQPEVLMYVVLSNGKMKLVGVEYIIFEAAWTGEQAPEFLGQTMALKNTVGVHPVDPFYEVHAWVWKHNPSGIFADWNPNVSCS